MNGQKQMIEIIVDGNETGRKIYTNGTADIEKIPQDVLNCFAEKLLDILLKKIK